MPRHHNNPRFIEEKIRVPPRRPPAHKKQTPLRLRRCLRCRRLFPDTLPRCDLCLDDE